MITIDFLESEHEKLLKQMANKEEEIEELNNKIYDMENEKDMIQVKMDYIIELINRNQD